MTVDDLLTEDLIAEVAGAVGRGLSIKFDGISPAVQERIQVDSRGATMFEPLWVWSHTPADRFLLVDEQKPLISAFVNGGDANPSDPRSEPPHRARGRRMAWSRF